MEKLRMCRLCMAEEVRLHNIVNTHLQEMYESLILIPLETTDRRPIQACYICCARLENCYQLRKRGLRSEELFTQMLTADIMQMQTDTRSFRAKRVTGELSNGLASTTVVHLTVGDVPQESRDAGVKLNPPGVLEDPGVRIKEEKDKEALYKSRTQLLEDDQSMELEDASSLDIKEELLSDDEIHIKDELLSDDHTEMCEDVPPNIVKNENFRTSAHEAETCSSPKEIEGAVHTTTFKQEQTVAEEGLYNKYTYEVPIDKLSTDRNYTILPAKSVDANHFTAGRSGLRVYSRSVNKNKSFACDICKEGFIKKSDLLKHTLNIHPCVQTDECESKNSAKEEIIDLSHTVTDFNQINYLATDENRSSKKSKTGAYLRHFYYINKPETVEYPYQCHICDKSYAYQSTLKGHMRVHRPKPHQCTECKVAFYHKSALEAHMYLHTQVKPYVCDICKRGFTSKQTLKLHIFEHPPIKKYKCDDCFKSFTYKTSLNSHIMRIHKGINQYQCHLCHQRFPYITSFKTHMQLHNFHTRFHCNVCKQYFSDKSLLESHMLVNHGKVSKL